MDDKADDNLRTGPRQLLASFLCLSSREAAPSGATPWGFRSAQNVIRRRRRAGLWRPEPKPRRAAHRAREAVRGFV